MQPNKQVEQQKIGELRKATGVTDNLHLRAALRDANWDLKKAMESLGRSAERNNKINPSFTVRSTQSLKQYFNTMRKLHEQRMTVWEVKPPWYYKEMEELDQKMLKNAKKWNEIRQPRNRYDLHYLTTRTALMYVEEIVEKVKGEGEFNVLELVTGAGNRSTYKAAPLKNEIVVAMKQMNCHAHESAENKGLIIVELY